jgi:hypothetical protein
MFHLLYGSTKRHESKTCISHLESQRVKSHSENEFTSLNIFFLSNIYTLRFDDKFRLNSF